MRKQFKTSMKFRDKKEDTGRFLLSDENSPIILILSMCMYQKERISIDAGISSYLILSVESLFESVYTNQLVVVSTVLICYLFLVKEVVYHNPFDRQVYVFLP